jgi:hypothetical protein
MEAMTESQRAEVQRCVDRAIAEHWPSGSTVEERGAALARYRANTATVEEQRAIALSLVIYTGGMGVLGCGTLPEQVPAIEEMRREHMRLLYGIEAESPVV